MPLLRIAAIAAVALLTTAAGKANWTATVTVAEGGQHVLGNPAAKVKLTEYVSYTCPHCSTFQKDSETTLRIAYVMSGKTSVKINHFVRDPVDLAATLLTNCGDPKGFFKRHHVFLYGQEKWLTRMGHMSEATKSRWRTGSTTSRLKAVARDFGFYEMMAKFGYSRPAVDRCLGDEQKARSLLAMTKEATEQGVDGTPSFALDGVVLAATHDWKMLQPQINARVK